MDELLSIPIYKELNVIQINLKDESFPEHKLENIPLDTSIFELQEQIYCKTDIPIENQYLFFVSPIDSFFYSLIDDLFSMKTFLPRKKILEFLDKILHESSEVEFTKTRISREILVEEIQKRKITTYLKPLNISFRNGIEYVRIDKSTGLSNTFIENNQNLNLTNYTFVENKIFLFSKDDIQENMESEIKEEILEKYFLDIKTKQTKDRICETSDEILSIYQDGENMRKFNEEYSKSINNFIENKIVDLTLLFTNFLINECDIQKIFNSVKLDENVVFSKISMRRKKHYFKIFKPMYFGDDAVISKKQFSSWRNIEFTSDEKDNFDTNAFIMFKILYSETDGKKDYITLLVNQKNQILLRLESGKIELDKLRDILFSFLGTLNSIVDCFKNIDGSKFMVEDNYKILDLSFVKEIIVEKNIPIKNLRTILENKSQYIFSLDYPINDRRFTYGYKRTGNFMVDKNVNHLIEKMVFTEGQTDSKKVKNRLKTIFPNINVNERYQSFLTEYVDERKSKYKLLMPHFTISTNENTFVIKMRHFSKLSELQIVSLLLKNIFEEYMVNKPTKVEQPAIRTATELTLPEDESSNEESNSNSNSNSSSPKGAMVGLNNSNSEKEENSLSSSATPENVAPEEDEGEIDISFGYEGYNYTTYMRAMRSHYDKKDELFTKGSNYTTKCRRQPYIVSKSHFERNINKPNQHNTLRGLDHQMIDSSGQLVNTSNYYLDSWDGKTVYICPRIWCVKCNLPVDPIHFADNKTCPKCGGSEIKGNGRMTDDKTIIIVSAENDYFKTDDKKKNYLQKLFDEAGKPVPEKLKNNEQRMYPKFLDANNPDVKKRLPCCYKGMKDDKREATAPREATEDSKPDVVDQKVFRFITESKFPMKKMRRLAVLPDDLDIMFDNTETNKIVEKLEDLSQTESKTLKELKAKKKPTTKQANKLKELEIKKKGYEYSFKFYGERKNIGFKRELSSFKMGNNYVSDNLFRLSVGDNKKTSFIDCIEELSTLLGESLKVSDIIQNEDVFTPLLFSQLNNGNLIEIFKSEIDDENLFDSWKRKNNRNLETLKITNDKSIRNLYSSYTNFKKYHSSSSFKNPDFYLDLLGREGIIFDEPVNIIILEKTSYDGDSKINLVCPKSFLGSNHINIKNNSIILINTGNYYEPVVGIRFISRKMELNKTIEPFEPIIFFNSSETNENQISRSNINTIMKLMISNCDEIKEDYRNNVFQNNLDNLSELRKRIGDDNISKFIIGDNYKIVAVLLKSKLLLSVIPSGLDESIIGKIETMDYVKTKLLSIEEYERLVEDEVEVLGSYKVKNYLSSKDKIHSLLLVNGTVIPIKKEPIGERETIDIEDIELDRLILEREETQDDRVRFNVEYNNYVQEQGIVKYIFNSFIREEDQEEVRDVIKKIIINPVMPIVEKKKRLKPILIDMVTRLFLFKTKPEIFGKGKRTKKCYKSRGCDDTCETNDDLCKNKITKKNILTNKDNKTYYIDYLIDELIRKTDGIDLITKKMNLLSDMDVAVSKDEIVFPDDLFEYQETDLYRKTKEKFVRNIELFNTIGQNDDKELDEEGLQRIKTGKTKIVKKKKGKKVEASITNIFGNKIKKTKIKAGECIFPYKLTLKQKQSLANTKKTSTTRFLDDCVPSIPERKSSGAIIGAEGLFCPTKVKGIYDREENFDARGKHTFWRQDTEKSKPYYLYEEREDAKPKGYCDTREYLNRIKPTELENKKINPKCVPRFKVKKTLPLVPSNYTEDGKEYTCLLENNPDKITDKFIPQFICPTEVDKEGVYDRVKSDKTESCFVDK